ncbi:MAG: hypothetical protein AAF608_05010 [Pseudomonadota bacterium]
MPSAYEQRFRSAMRKSQQLDVINATNQVIDGDDQSLGVLTQQHIPDAFLADLEQRRHDSVSAPIGDFALLARVPEALIIKWFRQGKNVYHADVKEIAKWLRDEEAEKFFATRKQLV